MEVKLTADETDKLTARVIDILRAEIINNAVKSEIYSSAEVLAKNLLSIHRPEIEAKCKQIDIMTPIVSNLLKRDNMLSNIVRSCIRSYFDTAEFKKLSISMLKDRIEAIENDLQQI